MIFVTVGTHEQPFNRLIQKIDELKKDGMANILWMATVIERAVISASMRIRIVWAI